jgi:hypothetical protein
MKKTIKITLIVLAVLAVVLFVFFKWTKSNSPFEKVELSSQGLTVTVEYCRPYMKNRKIFGELLPYGTVWRTGANEATLISFSRDVRLGGKNVKGGKYSLWTIPNQGNWTIIINRETGQWGTNYNEKEDLLRFEVPSQQLGQTVDQLTVQLKSAEKGIDMSINWENTGVTVPIR